MSESKLQKPPFSSDKHADSHSELLVVNWAAENAEAIAERRAWIEANGTLLADLLVLRSF